MIRNGNFASSGPAALPAVTTVTANTLAVSVSVTPFHGVNSTLRHGEAIRNQDSPKNRPSPIDDYAFSPASFFSR
jgi:hypothetical protein